MKTLKQHLHLITISESLRFDLGWRVARLWDKQKRGKKTYTIESDFKVRLYPLEFLEQEEVTDLILEYINLEFERLSNTF